MRLLAGLSIAIIALHNLLDSVSARALRSNCLALGHPASAKCLRLPGNKLRDGLSRAALDRRHGRRLLLGTLFSWDANAVNAS